MLLTVFRKNIQNLNTNKIIYSMPDANEIKLFYNNGNSTYYDYYTNIKDYYYVISYDNLVLTNIELTTETDTLENTNRGAGGFGSTGKF